MVYVHTKVLDEFLTILKEKMEKEPKFVKIVNRNHLKRVKSYMENHGGTLIWGEAKVNDAEVTFEKTVVLNPKKTSKLYTEEVFGPIMKIISFENIDEVIEEINFSEKSLVSYYFGSPRSSNKTRMELETSSGMFVANETVDFEMNHFLHFGGVGSSGSGCF